VKYSLYITYLLTYFSLHDAEYYLKSRLSLSLTKKILLSLWNPKVHRRVHSSPYIRVLKLRIRSEGHIAATEEMRNAYKILVGKPEGKRPPERNRPR
jgi:hypothetical protein